MTPMIPTVQIVHPEDPDDFMVINEADYDPDVHELIEGEDVEAAGSDSTDDGETTTGDSTDEPQLPDGYELDGGAGGYFTLTGPAGQVIEGPSNGKWQGREAAVQGAVDHAARDGGGE